CDTPQGLEASRLLGSSDPSYRLGVGVMPAWPVSWHLRMTHRGRPSPGYDAWGTSGFSPPRTPPTAGIPPRGLVTLKSRGLAPRRLGASPLDFRASYEGIASAAPLSPDSGAPAGSGDTGVVSREGLPLPTGRTTSYRGTIAV